MSQQDNVCTQKEQHPRHICEMKKRGENDMIKTRSQKPTHVCHNCNATADNPECLCNPGVLP